MEWPGIEDDTSDIGSGMKLVQNVSYGVAEELRRRSGLAEKKTVSGFEIAELPDQSGGTYYLMADASGNVKSVNEATGSVATLKAGLGTTADNIQRGSFARYGSRMYFCNGFDAPVVFESGSNTSPRDMGITAPAGTIGAPSTGAAGSNDNGIHRFRYRYFDGNTGYYSDPSIALEVTVAGNTKLTFGIGVADDIVTPSQANVDTIKVEETVVSGTEYYVAATVNRNADGTWPASVEIDISDLALQEQPTLGSGTGNAPPPLFDWMIEHRGRLFGIGADTVTLTDANPTNGSATVTSAGNAFSTEWAGRLMTFANATDSTKRYRIASVASAGSLTLSSNFAGTGGAQGASVFSGNPDRLYWSGAGLPEGWDATTNARDVLQGESDVPAGMASYQTDLYLMGQRTMRRLMYDSDPGFGQLDKLPTDMGIWNQRCLVVADGQLYGWGRNGAWAIQGIMPRHISKRVDSTVRGRYDASQYKSFHGVFDPVEREITWWYVPASGSTPTEGICLDVDSGKWSLRQFSQGIIGSASVTDATGESWALLADSNGYSWFLKQGLFDGIESGEETVFTVDVGASTTVVPVLEAVQADAVGVYAYRVSDGTYRQITSNTTSSFTVTTPWASAPAHGETFYLGVIDSQFQSKWSAEPDPDEKKRTQRAGWSFIPDDADGEFRVYYYADFSATSKLVTKLATDKLPNGVSITNGASFLTVSFDIDDNPDGYVPAPSPSDYHRFWAVKMQCLKPKGTLKLYGYKIGVESSREVNE